jgi:hypothetical protein
MRKHYITFFSPGTFFSESSTKPIDAWDPVVAVKMAEQITERYNATPYGFQFSTRLEASPVPDGEGGELKVESKVVEKSGMYFLGGTVLSVEDIERRGGNNEILLSNMRGNGHLFVVETIARWTSTHPLEEKDVVVDSSGRIVERGDTPDRVAARKKWQEERDKKWG